MTVTTWDPSNKASSITLSGGNLTGSIASGPGPAFPMQATSSFSGKIYFEVAINPQTACGGTGASFSVGIGPQISNFGYYFNGPGDGFVVSAASAQVYNNDTPEGSSHGLTSGDHVVMVAYDQPGNKVYFGVDGTWIIGDPNAGTGGSTPINGGALFPEMDFESFASAAAPHPTGIANFGATLFTYTTPTGYAGFDTPPLNAGIGTSAGIGAASGVIGETGVSAGLGGGIAFSAPASAIGSSSGRGSAVGGIAGVRRPTINYTFNSTWDVAPNGSFPNGTALAAATAVINQVMSDFADLIDSGGSITISVGSGTVSSIGGTAFSSGSLVSGSFGYSDLVALMAASKTDFIKQRAYPLLPGSSPLPGGFTGLIKTALKALIQNVDDTTITSTGGSLINMSTDFGWDYNTDPTLVAPGTPGFYQAAFHELTEICGRFSGLNADATTLDLFSYTSPGTLDFVHAHSRYFSPDGGITNMGSYATGGTDPNDFDGSLLSFFNAGASPGPLSLRPEEITMFGTFGLPLTPNAIQRAAAIKFPTGGSATAQGTAVGAGSSTSGSSADAFPPGAVATLGAGQQATAIVIQSTSGAAGSTSSGAVTSNVRPNVSTSLGTTSAGSTQESITFTSLPGAAVTSAAQAINDLINAKASGASAAIGAGNFLLNLSAQPSGAAGTTHAGPFNGLVSGFEAIIIVPPGAAITGFGGIFGGSLASGAGISLIANITAESESLLETGASSSATAGSAISDPTAVPHGTGATGSTGTVAVTDAVGSGAQTQTAAAPTQETINTLSTGVGVTGVGSSFQSGAPGAGAPGGALDTLAGGFPGPGVAPRGTGPQAAAQAQPLVPQVVSIFSGVKVDTSSDTRPPAMVDAIVVTLNGVGIAASAADLSIQINFPGGHASTSAGQPSETIGPTASVSVQGAAGLAKVQKTVRVVRAKIKVTVGDPAKGVAVRRDQVVAKTGKNVTRVKND